MPLRAKMAGKPKNTGLGDGCTGILQLCQSCAELSQSVWQKAGDDRSSNMRLRCSYPTTKVGPKSNLSVYAEGKLHV